jgi:20S proteasome alpha/beta subunit
MTIAAGFRFDGGVLLCADSEETRGDAVKVSVPKIEVFDKRYSKLVVTGAGDSDLLDRAFEELDRRIPARNSEVAIVQTIENLVRELYAKYVYPHPGEDKPRFELLVGFQRNGKADFVKMSNTAVVRPKLQQVIGYGVPHAAPLLDRWARDGMSESETVLLATWVLQQTKRYVPYCGGESRICVLRHDGRADWVPRAATLKLERYSDLFDEAIREAFFAGADASLSVADFTRLFNHTALEVSMLHKLIVDDPPLRYYVSNVPPSVRPRRKPSQSSQQRLEALLAPQAPKRGRKRLPASRA